MYFTRYAIIVNFIKDNLQISLENIIVVSMQINPSQLNVLNSNFNQEKWKVVDI